MKEEVPSLRSCCTVRQARVAGVVSSAFANVLVEHINVF